MDAARPDSGRWRGPARTVLLVDDEPMILRAAGRVLRAAGFDLRSTPHLDEARRMLATESPDVVVSDLHMPKESGAAFLEEVSVDHPRAVRILLTADPDFRSEGRRVSAARVHALLTKFELRDLRRVVIALLSARDAPASAAFDTAAALGDALARPGHEDRAHRRRVAAWTAHLAARLGAGDDELRAARLGALVHDIGQATVSQPLLARDGPLTRVEHDQVKAHPEAGARILADVPSLKDAIPLVRAHHERFDGKGYPGDLAGDAIPRVVRAFQVADAFDAMVQGRPYRAARPYAIAMREIVSVAGTQLDPEAARTFAALDEAELGAAITA
jgi:response regulator RpfG family c-di-GMP phosphodiesterase